MTQRKHGLHVAPEPATTSVDFAEEDPEHGVLSCIVEWLEIAVPQYHAVA
jgi:hypothetical protein